MGLMLDVMMRVYCLTYPSMELCSVGVGCPGVDRLTVTVTVTFIKTAVLTSFSPARRMGGTSSRAAVAPSNDNDNGSLTAKPTKAKSTPLQTLAIDARIPLMMLSSTPVWTGIQNAWIVSSEVCASRAIHGARQGNTGRPNRWQIRLIKTPAGTPAIVSVH